MTRSTKPEAKLETPLRAVCKPAFLVWLISLIIISLFFFVFDLAWGSVKMPLNQVVRILFGAVPAEKVWGDIVLNIRLTKTLTALLVGAALSVSGLLMQTFFRNPLADPFILGINSGASLGVALAVLTVGAAGSVFLSGLNTFGDLALAFAAILGAILVFVLVILIARRVASANTLLVVGIMLGYAASSVVSMLIYFSVPERVQSYLIWTFGSFGGVTWNQLSVMAPLLLFGLILSALLPKMLNGLLLGEEYARSMGMNIRRTRLLVLLAASILSGAATAFCGPIGFLGVAIPHLARNLIRSSDHKKLLPIVMLLGESAALLADILSQLPGTSYSLPINVITSFFGAPFVLWIVLRGRKQGGFNV